MPETMAKGSDRVMGSGGQQGRTLDEVVGWPQPKEEL